jgi:hypothetical protein
MAAIAIEQDSQVDEARLRQAYLMRLRHELARIGVWTRVRRPSNGRWKLTLRNGFAPALTALCGGAEGAYAYVTGDGRLLGPVTDVRYVARTLAWMVEEHYR